MTAAKAVHEAWTRPGSLTLVVSPSGRQSGEFDESLWRPLEAKRLLRTNPQWQLVSPDVPSLPLDAPQFSDLRYLAGFMIGENENNWSNAALVRSLARIMNARGTELRLIQRVGDTVLAPVEKPGVHFTAGRDDVLAGMRGVIGRNRVCDASTAASQMDFPSTIRRSRATSTIRMPFLADNAISSIRPIWV